MGAGLDSLSGKPSSQYPTNILDLMILYWSQQSEDRPSSSQLVSIATAPEFAHCLDLINLADIFWRGML